MRGCSAAAVGPGAIAAAFWAGVNALAFHWVSARVPEQVMDEVFHVRQTQQYCSHNFGVWDPKITTFPGTYALAFSFAHLYRQAIQALPWLPDAMHQLDPCSLYGLRLFNVLLSCVLPFLAAATVQLLHPSISKLRAAAMALSLSMLPTHTFFTRLFYTDCAGLVFMAASQLAALQGGWGWSALWAGGGVLCRQTNIVWAAFICGDALLCEFRKEQLGRGQGGADVIDTPGVLRWMVQAPGRAIVIVRGFVLLAVTFAAFVMCNGAIVVGDRDAHSPQAHLVQPLYFLLFWGVSCSPSLPWKLIWNQAISSRTMATAVAMCLALAGMGAAVATGTVAHPYLLADNRHITFYIWKDILQPWRIVRYLLLPFYLLFGFAAVVSTQAQGSLVALGFSCCLAMVLVPAGLVEFRYFTIPTYLLYLRLCPSAPALALQILCFLAVDVAMLALFCEHSFLWPDGSVARFMW